MRSATLCAGLGLLGIAALARAAEDPPPLAPAEVKAGRTVYRHACASCHGARGEGAPNWERLDAQGEMPAPPHDKHGHTWRHSDAMLYRIIQTGWRDEFNKTKRLTMPAFAGQLSPKEIVAVITYLKTLWTRDQRRFQWEESRREPFRPEAR
jgi:mono/diheme cytochrome c family protein